jgi:hypothetical protein
MVVHTSNERCHNDIDLGRGKTHAEFFAEADPKRAIIVCLLLIGLLETLLEGKLQLFRETIRLSLFLNKRSVTPAAEELSTDVDDSNGEEGQEREKIKLHFIVLFRKRLVTCS